MAEAVPREAVNTECGYCLQKLSSVEDPKALPCSHRHCLECLTTHFNKYKIVRCPTCREVFDVTLDSLPSATENNVEEKPTCCDVCVKKGGDNHPAVVYCTICSKKYCDKHKQYHDELSEDHPCIEINEYRTQAQKLETRTCEQHVDQPYFMGCKSCIKLLCTTCLSGVAATACTDGTPHDLLPTGGFLTELTKEINDLKEELLNKAEKLADFFKLASKTRSDYESETAELVETLHKTRDEQIEVIRMKYDELEKELLRLRAQTVQSMTKFMEEEVWVQMSNLDRHRLRIEASFRDNHKVDFVSRFRDTKSELKQLIGEGMPVLDLRNTTSLEKREENRQIELVKITKETGHVLSELGLSIFSPLTKSLKLLKTVQLSSWCRCVYPYEGVTYCGLDNGTVVRIDNNYALTNLFTCVSKKAVDGLTAFSGRLYVLVNRIVYVYDISGQLITQWTHADNTTICNKLPVVNNQLIIPDRQNKRLTVYSLSGTIIKHIPCPQLGNSHVAACRASEDSVIVSDCLSSQVFRVNITTGEVIWTSTHVSTPLGITCYRDRYVPVVSVDCNKIRILDVSSGEFVSELTGDGIGGYMFDLQTDGTTLIAPKYHDKQVLFFQLVSED